ncbi:MAG: M56 family metallopeptidase [Planctomycetota bacterium]|jgi:beta-lactamase regulating signal transducer with metallopeptidase domain
MMGIEQLLNQPWAQRLGWSLVHFLWQGLVIAAGLSVAMAALRRRSANLRYALACMAMVAMVAGPAVTFCLLPAGSPPGAPAGLAGLESLDATTAEGEHAPSAAVPAPPEARALDFVPDAAPAEAVLPATATDADHQASPAAIGWADRASRLLEPALPWMVAAWVLGVALLGIWHVGGWAGLLRLKRSALPLGQAGPEGQCTAAAGRIAGQLGLPRPIRLLKSARIAGPLAMGILRPSVLMPVTVLTGLPMPHIEAILAHEIAHLRRYDYLVNLLQGLVETVLFYHPAVWWVSGRIRVERENCCDDVAVGVCGDHTTYVAALASVAESSAGAPRARRPRLAAARRLAPGASGSMLARVRRLLALPGGDAARADRWLAGVLVVASLAIAGVFLCAATSSADAAATKELERLWGELGSIEAVRADRAIAAMAAMGDRAVAFLATRLTPGLVDARTMEDLVKRLDSDDYGIRRSARKELDGLGRAALGQARRILKQGKLSAEVRSRLVEFVSEYGAPLRLGANARRFDRAIAVLASIGDEGAKGLLKRLSASEPADRLSKRARAALVRLAAPQEMQGTVRDGRGRPVEGAKVSLYYLRSHWGLGNAVVDSSRHASGLRTRLAGSAQRPSALPERASADRASAAFVQGDGQTEPPVGERTGLAQRRGRSGR